MSRSFLKHFLLFSTSIALLIIGYGIVAKSSPLLPYILLSFVFMNLVTLASQWLIAKGIAQSTHGQFLRYWAASLGLKFFLSLLFLTILLFRIKVNQQIVLPFFGFYFAYTFFLIWEANRKK